MPTHACVFSLSNRYWKTWARLRCLGFIGSLSAARVVEVLDHFVNSGSYQSRTNVGKRECLFSSNNGVASRNRSMAAYLKGERMTRCLCLRQQPDSVLS